MPKQQIAVTTEKNGAFHPNGRWQAIAIMGNYRFQAAGTYQHEAEKRAIKGVKRLARTHRTRLVG